MTLAFVLGAIYVRGNMPPRPGVYWLSPYPSADTPTKLQKKAEASASFQAALKDTRAEQRALILRAGAVWILSGATLYILGLVSDRRRRAA